MIIDVTQPLREGIPTWPGDTPFKFRLNWTKAESGSVNVGSVEMSIHTGTHIDAPYHFDDNGAKVKDLDLELYIGAARVIELKNSKTITPEDLSNIALDGCKRLLIKTGSWKDQTRFPKEITVLSPDLPAFLAEKGVRLIGLDVPSVDPLDSKELLAHHSLHQNGIHILEGLVLDHVEPGDYELIALPLSVEEADGSPVRAILRK
jgi:arylformamidase